MRLHSPQQPCEWLHNVWAWYKDGKVCGVSTTHLLKISFSFAWQNVQNVQSFRRARFRNLGNDERTLFTVPDRNPILCFRCCPLLRNAKYVYFTEPAGLALRSPAFLSHITNNPVHVYSLTLYVVLFVCPLSLPVPYKCGCVQEFATVAEAVMKASLKCQTFVFSFPTHARATKHVCPESLIYRTRTNIECPNRRHVRHAPAAHGHSSI